MNPKIKLLYILIIILVIFIAIVIARKNILSALSQYLVINRPTEKADVIVVMGGVSERRVPFAVQSFHKGSFDKIIFICGKDEKHKKECNKKYGVPILEAEFVKIIARKENIPEEKFQILEDSISTMDDIKKLYEYYQQNNFKSAVIVTDSIHSRRTFLCLKKVFPKNSVDFYSNLVRIDNNTAYVSDPHDLYIYTINEYIKIISYTIGMK